MAERLAGEMCQNRKRLDRTFYMRDALSVAKDILGKYLVHDHVEGRTVGRIVETEAYLGAEDPASHAFGGKKTDRTSVQYDPGGRAYVYLIYGRYHCFNVVTGGKGEPESVFIRALEPIEGEELMKERRGLENLSGTKMLELTNGPGKLSMAMGIHKEDTGKDLCRDDLYVVEPSDPEKEKFEIGTGSRVNIDYAGEAKDRPWRFYVEGSEYLSKYDTV